MSDDPAETDEEDAPDDDAGADSKPTAEDVAEEEETSDGIAGDDFVTLAVTAYSVDSDTLVDTTDPEVAEDEGIDTEEQSFEPRTIPLGAGHLFPSVEDDIIGRSIGDSGVVEVPVHEAFGEYNPDDVRTVSADTIPEDNRYPGAQVELDGEYGYVETIIGGRARVDFNHPLAGEAIRYEYEILDQPEDRLEKTRSLLSSVVDADLEMWFETTEEEQEVPVESDADEEDEDDEPETELQTVELEILYIESVPQLAFNQQWMFRKQQIAQEIIDRIGVDRIIVQETIEGMDMGGIPGLGGMEGLEDLDAEDIADDIDDVAELTPDE